MTYREYLSFISVRVGLLVLLWGCLNSPVVPKNYDEDGEIASDSDSDSNSDSDSDSDSDGDEEGGGVPTIDDVAGWWELVSFRFEAYMYEDQELIDTDFSDEDYDSVFIEFSGDRMVWYTLLEEICYDRWVLEVSIYEEGILTDEEGELSMVYNDDDG